MFRFLSAANADERMAESERFIEFWYGARRPEFGEPDATSLDPQLPGSLRRFYAFAGRWPSPNLTAGEEFFYSGSGHHLLSLDDVSPTKNGRLRFFMEYQGDWYGVTNPREPDPPVWISGRWDDQEKGKRTRKVSKELSRFLVTHCLMTTVYDSSNSPHPRQTSRTEDIALADWLQRDRQSAELLWKVEPGCCPNYEGSFLLFHGHILVHDMGQNCFHFGALHPEGFELLRAVIGDAA
jgi:hypothetical protein